jgi:hypothetical protein
MHSYQLFSFSRIDSIANALLSDGSNRVTFQLFAAQPFSPVWVPKWASQASQKSRVPQQLFMKILWAAVLLPGRKERLPI